MRWDGRIEKARAAADARCSADHSEAAIVAWKNALAHPRRENVIARR